MTEVGDDFKPEGLTVGYILLFSSLVCLGTWPAFLRVASMAETIGKRGNGQERCYSGTNRARDVRLAYLDYAFSYAMISLIPLLLQRFLLGKNKEIRDDSTLTLHKLRAQSMLMGFACLGGVFLSFGNLSLQWATTVYQAPLTTVVAIQGSLTVLIGTLLNALLENFSKTPHPLWLVVGVVLFLIAIGFATLAQKNYSASVKRFSARIPSNKNQCQCAGINTQSKVKNHQEKDDRGETLSLSIDYPDEYLIGNIELQPKICPNGTIIVDHEDDRLPKCDIEIASETLNLHSYHGYRSHSIERVSISSYSTINPSDKQVAANKNPSQKALVLAILGGCSFGFFSPAFNVAVNDPFRFTGDSDLGLSVPLANLCFSVTFTVASIVGTWVLWKFPPRSSGISPSESMFHEYQKSISFQQCRWGSAAGMICGVANLLQFQGGRLVGFATADLVQAFPLVSTVWDFCWFGEFNHHVATSTGEGARMHKTYWYLAGMYVLYLGGIFCMMRSATM